MKVLIVNNMAPFVWGGAEELATHLCSQLHKSGHEAEVLRIPFQWEPAENVISQMLLVRNLELWNVDRVIALKFPAYLIRHHHKTIWLLHQFRQAYDLFDAGLSHIRRDALGDNIRRSVREADVECFRGARKVFSNSEVTRERLLRYNDINSEVLFPPLNDAGLFAWSEPQGYVFAGGRVNGMKRQHLLVEAMAYTNASTRLIVAGPPDSAADADRLRGLVDHHDLHNKVKLDLRFLDRQEVARYVSESSSCAYIPYDEDSLGYVAMEAAEAGKAIVSASDSGGILGLVRDEETGWVRDPDPCALAAALDEACSDCREVARRGASARRLWQGMGINWPETIRKLLA